MSFNIVFSSFAFLVLIFLGCDQEKDHQLLKIVDSFEMIFDDEELNNIKNLNKDSLYDSNYETYKKYLLLFDEDNESLESTVYFNSKGISSGSGFKFDFLTIALHHKLNNNSELINFPQLRESVMHRSYQLNKARLELDK